MESLELIELLNVDTKVFKPFLGLFPDAQVYEIVLHQLSDKELHREIIHSLVFWRLERCRSLCSRLCLALDELGEHFEFIFVVQLVRQTVEHGSGQLYIFRFKIF